MPNTPKLVIPIEADIKKAAANLAKIKSNTKSSIGGIGGIVGGVKKNFLALAAGAAASGFAIKKFLGVAAEFEQSIANVAAVSGGARKELAALARQTGATTVFSAKEAADAMYFLASAGLAVDDMTTVLNPALNLAAAAQIGVAEATDLTINSLKIYNAEMSEAADFTDIMAKAVQSANTDMPQLGEAIKVAGSTAKLAGVSFKDLNVLIAGMANQGIKGSEAGTKLRQAFARLLKPTAEAQKTLLKYNITQTDIANNIKDPIKLFKLLAPAISNTADATEILGVRQLAVAGLIKNGIPDLENLRDALNDAGGTAERMAKEQLNTLQGSLKLLQSAFQEVILSGAGEGGLLDIFKSIVNTLIGAVQAFQGVPGPLKAITIGIGLLVPAFIALQAAMGPIGLIFLAVGAAMSVLIPKMVDFESVSKKMENVTNELVEIQREYKEIIEKLNDPTKKLTKSTRALLELRKTELELKEKEKLDELIKLRERLSFSIDREKIEHDKNAKAVEKSSKAIIRARKLQKLWVPFIERTTEQTKKLVKAYNEENDVTRKQAGTYNVIRLAAYDIAKAKREHKKATDDLTASKKKLNDFDIVENKLVNDLALAYINERDSLEGLKITQADLFALGTKISNKTTERIKQIDAEAAAAKKLAAENKKNGIVTNERTQEEIKALEELEQKRRFLNVFSLASDEELTTLTLENIDKRIEGWKKEVEQRALFLKNGNELLKTGLEIASNLFDGFMQNRFDRTNEFQDKLNNMDKEDRERTKETLQQEINALSLSTDAADKKLAEDKKRELERMNLEDAAAERDKQIKRNEAIANRKSAVLQRIGSAFSIAAETAVGIAKAIAASPLTLGAPWSAGILASGIGAEAALFSKPLPPIPAFAKGGNFQTKGPMLAMLGDNPGGRENVNVTPLKSYQSNDNSVKSESSINIDKIVIPANSPEELFNKIYDYAKDMGLKIVRRG